jgi:hypothetical protein
MTIAKVLAVYKTTPIILVVEPAKGPVGSVANFRVETM